LLAANNGREPKRGQQIIIRGEALQLTSGMLGGMEISTSGRLGYFYPEYIQFGNG
jgi:hypothetical protein